MLRAIPYTSLWFWISLWILISGALLTGTSWQLRQNYLFAHHSQPVLGIVERKFMRVSHDKHGEHYTPCLVYRYQVENMTIHSESSVQGDTYSSLPERGYLPLLYLPQEVTDNRIDMPTENSRVRLTTYLAMGITFLILVGGAGSIYHYVRRNRINRDLITKGISCLGVVTAVNYDLVGKGRTKAYYLVVEFRDTQGRPISGRTWYLSRGDEDLWQENARIQVYFNSLQPEQFTVDLNSGPKDS